MTLHLEAPAIHVAAPGCKCSIRMINLAGCATRITIVRHTWHPFCFISLKVCPKKHVMREVQPLYMHCYNDAFICTMSTMHLHSVDCQNCVQGHVTIMGLAAPDAAAYNCVYVKPSTPAETSGEAEAAY